MKKKNIGDIVKNIKEIAVKHLDGKDLEKLNLISDRIKGENPPMIIIYGVYNAGKSSLVNALTGEEVAEVGKIPTTDRISEYRYHNSILLDTPGIDAPVEHEELAEKTLFSADAVIFVMQNGGSFDCTITAQKLVALIKRKIPALIVFTRRDNMTTKDPGFSEIVSKLQKNIVSAAEKSGLKLNAAELPDVFLVDTKIALEGKKSGNPEMTESSGILYFEDRLNMMIGKCDIEKRKEQALKEIMDDIVPLITMSIESKIPSEKIKEIQENLRRIENRKNTFIMQCVNDAASAIRNCGNGMRDGAETGEESLNNELAEIIIENSGTILEYFDNIGVTVEIPGIERGDLSEHEKRINSGNVKYLKEIMKSPIIVKKMQKGIMKLGKMTGKTKYAAKASKFLGKAAPVISAVLTVAEIALLIKESGDHEAEMRRNELEIENAVRTWEAQTLKYFKETVKNFANEITLNPVKDLSEEMDKLVKNHSDLKMMLDEIKNIEMAVISIPGHYVHNTVL
ncbi:MAG TPA: 50S ribosome-binding GTPase [bacterium]|nr:50S ribosome-binding GTPase [bacterium]